jgi:hypothetical protein
MIEIGKTIAEARNLVGPLWQLSDSEKIGLMKFLVSATGVGKESELDEDKDVDLIELGSFGGYPFLVEGVEGDFDEMVQNGCPDLSLSEDENEAKGNLIGFDIAVYLDDFKGAALFMVATNNAGGNIYVVPKGVMDKFPNARSYVVETTTEYLGPEIEVDPF